MTGSSPIRILTVDDHPLVREGIAGLVGVQPDMTLVAEAANGREAIQQFRAHRPDVTLMDLQMPEMNGLDAVIAIRTEFPEARIIVLTTYEGDAQILRAVKAGAQGYLLKNTLHSDLLQTIRTVHAGKRSLSPEVVVPDRSACERRDADTGGSRRVAPHRGREREQADCRSARRHGGHRQGPSQEHPCETRRQRSDARGDHRPEAGHHRALAFRQPAALPDSRRHHPKESLPRPGRGFASRCPRRIIVWRCVLRRLYSTFAGSWPGIGLLLMRLVIGSVVICACGSAAVERPAAARSTLASASLAGSGLLLLAGLWTPVAGAVVAVIEISQILSVAERPVGGPVGSNHRCRSGDAGAGALVGRRSTLRMEAHRVTWRKTLVRAWAEPGAPRPKGSPASHPTESSPRHPIQSSN